jgi:ABC-2 type transport system ATP-binding protein
LEEKRVIELKNVTKKYGPTTAVDDISFEVKDGEIVGLLGPNGAGKTTTMNMITGYIEQTSGQILVNGNDILKKPNKVKKQIGYMPEGTPLYYELTPKEFISYMAELKLVKRKERKDEVARVLKEVGIEDVQDRLIKNLSRGYKQRVSLAGALVGNPDVIILDEPTVGLDPKQITEIRELIKKLGKKHTVILSSHILSEVSQICERVIIINKGKIVAIDTPENLEKATRDNNAISITIEDPKNNINKIKEKIKEISKVDFIKDNDDGTKEYAIISSSNVDLRKKLFDVLPKMDIVIFELKKSETTLEEAFIKLIDNSKNNETKSNKKEEKK